MEITEKVQELVRPYLDAHEIELVEIMYRREQGGMVLRLLVDTPERISIEECGALNNHLSEILDKEDIIQEQYTIEVASPGLDRHLKTDRDFGRVMGAEIEATTYERIDGRKTHSGALIGMDDESIVIESAGISTVIPRKSIAVARMKVEFVEE
jgi:ribosome maturation factor RimP